jgi:hypothetical protein
MPKKHKIVFNLTIKDLKDLGILKKKKKRKSKRRIKNDIAYNQIKSSSSHMQQPPAQFMNMNNLQSENLKLQNNALELLQNKIENKIENKEENQMVVSNPQIERLQQLENNFNNHKLDTQTNLNYTHDYINDLYNKAATQYSSRFTGNPSAKMDSSNVYNVDNIDVNETEGSDSFQNAFGVSIEKLNEDNKEEKEIEQEKKDSLYISPTTTPPKTPINENEDETIFEETNPMLSVKQKIKDIEKQKTDYEKQISNKDENLKRNKSNLLLLERKKLYIKLIMKENKIPDEKLLQATDLKYITAAIKKEFPDFYASNIAKK